MPPRRCRRVQRRQGIRLVVRESGPENAVRKVARSKRAAKRMI